MALLMKKVQLINTLGLNDAPIFVTRLNRNYVIIVFYDITSCKPKWTKAKFIHNH